MPFLPLISGNPELMIGMWKVEEDENFFLSRLSIYENEARILEKLRHPAKRLEWLSSRLCLKELLHIAHKVESLNEATGKPYLSDHSFQISYSHSNMFSGAVASPSLLVSMDLEDLSKKRNPDTRFLFMHPQELESYERQADPRIFFLTWSAKETLYKLYANKGLVFKEHLRVNPEEQPLGTEGTVNGWIERNGEKQIFPIHYRFFPEVVLTYTAAECILR